MVKALLTSQSCIQAVYFSRSRHLAEEKFHLALCQIFHHLAVGHRSLCLRKEAHIQRSAAWNPLGSAVRQGQSKCMIACMLRENVFIARERRSSLQLCQVSGRLAIACFDDGRIIGYWARVASCILSSSHLWAKQIKSQIEVSRSHESDNTIREEEFIQRHIVYTILFLRHAAWLHSHFALPCFTT